MQKIHTTYLTIDFLARAKGTGFFLSARGKINPLLAFLIGWQKMAT